ncbi:hypothetical protein C8R45DRAFT_817527 [Mycena sanguinolenta]|nr:hypothetical protein C8R45DRAFT_817527 [Mycena sanguinolenta]
MNPIRLKLRGFELLKEVLPFSRWTTATGLASRLVFMSTGQCSLTSEFLSRIAARPEKFYFTSLDNAVAEFDAVENDRATFAPAHQIKYCNPAIYATANPWYSLHPSIQIGPKQWVSLSIREKFSPFFSPELGRSYENLIGQLKGQDPSISGAPKITWAEALRWIVETRLGGFGSGLAPLQFANNLTLAGIATPPSPAELAQWIFLNNGLGAFAGLQTCGFQLSKSDSPATVRAAFFCFYSWLDHFLSDEDKTTLGFGAIFAEHLLCKVGRWKKRLYHMSGKTLDLSVMAQGLFEGMPWLSAENLMDDTKWPIPPCTDFDISVFKSIVEDG